jgi:hypothetical protein
MSVHCDTAEEIGRAKELMKGMGAKDIASTGEAVGENPETTRAA